LQNDDAVVKVLKSSCHFGTKPSTFHDRRAVLANSRSRA
jgi:hypothetical protein